MDPVAHTLFGATLAQTRLKHLTPLAAATLMIGANLPDVDVVVSAFGSDVSLLHRRGWTHGVVAMVVLPVVLAAVMVLYDRWFRRRRDPTREPVDPRGVLILSCLGVWSHPLLDWLNTYGVRLLMPFDGRWFYGDALFIIDPWMWLLMGATVVFAWSGGLLSKGGWAVLGLLTTALVTWAPMVPVAAKVVWWVGIGVILVARIRGVEPAANQRWAAVCVAAFFVYVGLTMTGNQVARQGVEQWLESQGFSGAEVAMTGPVPANPFAREVVAVTDEYYLGAEVRWWRRAEVYRLRYEPVLRVDPDETVKRALEAHEARGFVNWMRFPVYEVREDAGGTEVLIRDLRYVDPDEEDSPGIGMIRVRVD